MKKPTKSNWQNTAFTLVMACVVVLALASGAAAQSEIQFNVLYNCPGNSWYYFKVIECPSEERCRVAFYKSAAGEFSYESNVYKKMITDAFKGGNCTIDGKKPEAVETTQSKQNNQTDKAPQTAENKDAKAGRFKVGDRVQACGMQMDNHPACWKNCTVLKDMMVAEGADSYQVECDDPQGGMPSLPGYVPSKYVRGGAPPAPATPACPFNEPPGTVSKTSKPSAELFKRVIFEWYRDNAQGRKVGVTFQTFDLGQPFVNRLTGKGLLHDGAPQNAMIYPVKTRYLRCDRYTDSTLRWLTESQFACFKDKFGEWICPVDSVPKYLEQIRLPNK